MTIRPNPNWHVYRFQVNTSSADRTFNLQFDLQDYNTGFWYMGNGRDMLEFEVQIAAVGSHKAIVGNMTTIGVINPGELVITQKTCLTDQYWVDGGKGNVWVFRFSRYNNAMMWSLAYVFANGGPTNGNLF